jgi:mono/diheme cytochrome c family protein
MQAADTSRAKKEPIDSVMTSAKKFMRGIGAAAAAAVCLFPITANAEEIGDAAIGSAFALKYCAECHAVKPGEAYSPNPGAPSFTSVAKTSGMTGRALAVWLDNSHPTMPNFILHAEQRDNVISYIMSLKSEKPK